jgi:hypothetical protein
MADKASINQAKAILADPSSTKDEMREARELLNRAREVMDKKIVPETPIQTAPSSGPRKIESLFSNEEQPIRKAKGGYMGKGGKPVGVGAAERGFGAVRRAAKGGKVGAAPQGKLYAKGGLMSRGVAKKGFGVEVR